MYNLLIREISYCFGPRDDPANCFGAPALMEKKHFWDEIDLDDDEDLGAIIDLAREALSASQSREDEPNADFVKYLIEHGFDINARVPGHDCLLLQTAKRNFSPEMFLKLLDLGADPYAENSDGDNLLVVAAKREYKPSEEEEKGALVRCYVEHVDITRVEGPDRYGITPLMYAVENGHILLVKTLLDNGADVNAVGTVPDGGNGLWVPMDGVSPLALACRMGEVGIAKLLLEAGADEKLRDNRGMPPIFSLLRYPFKFEHSAQKAHPIYKNKQDILAMMKEIELTDGEGYTLLMRSMQEIDHWEDTAAGPYENMLITQDLLARGANIEVTANDGKRPLHLAVLTLNKGDFHKKLVKMGAELNVQDNDGNTPLHIACYKSTEIMVRYLIKAGADSTIQNNEGKTAMDLCAERRFNSAIELMLEA